MIPYLQTALEKKDYIILGFNNAPLARAPI